MSASNPKNWWKTLTQAFQTWRPSPPGGTVRLEPNSSQTLGRSVQLRVNCPDEPVKTFPLLGSDTYVGRNERACQIRIPARSVSQVHARIQERRLKLGKLVLPRFLEGWVYLLGWYPSRYILRDQESTNGTFRGRRRIQTLFLSHRRRFSLGPPQDPESVTIEVVDPPPVLIYIARGVWLSVAGLMSVVVIWVVQEWPKIPVDPLPTSQQGPLIILGGDGQTQLRRTLADTKRELPNLQAFGSDLPKVVVASEDHRFYFHGGVDLLGILRALTINIRAGELQQGGSSISQQLARTVLRDYTGTDNSFWRKCREAVAALKLETRYSKQEILTLYLNNVYLGNGLYGFEAASEFYFGVPANQLDLSQAATLVSILPAPNVFNPVDNFNLALKGRERVLDRLQELNIYPADTIRRARRSRLLLNPKLNRVSQTLAPYFYNTVLKELNQLLGKDLAAEGNFIIETTVQLPMQILAEQAVADTVKQSGSRYQFGQGALVTLNSQNGEVLALVGGSDYATSQFNRAVQAQRQPGSTFKVFAYTAAIEQGISPGQGFSCAPLTWGQTFRGCRSGAGSLSLAQGLALSENVIALRVAQQVGMNKVVTMAQRMGITSPVQPYPATVLGVMEVNLLELTSAFAVLADDGIRTHPHTIRRILDSSDCPDPQTFSTCREIYPLQTDPLGSERVLDPAVARTMTQLLQTAITSGTGQAAYLGLGEAGKTGTTTNNKDLVFVGYLPRQSLVTGIWLGNDDAKPTLGSSAQAARLWGLYMRQVLGR